VNEVFGPEWPVRDVLALEEAITARSMLLDPQAHRAAYDTQTLVTVFRLVTRVLTETVVHVGGTYKRTHLVLRQGMYTLKNFYDALRPVPDEPVDWGHIQSIDQNSQIHRLTPYQNVS
jgi:hypothetical protein